jgi:DNA-binding transcriptional ArsR family regulator
VRPRFVLLFAVALLLSPPPSAGEAPHAAGMWWTVEYVELHSKQSAAVTFLRFNAEGSVHEIGMSTQSFHAFPFVLPLFPFGEVDAETLAYKVENQTFQPLPRTISNGTTWVTQWGKLPLRGEVRHVSADHVWIQFYNERGSLFSDLEYDPARHLIVRHVIPQRGSATLRETGPASACHGVYPARVDGFPIHSMIGSPDEDPTSRIGRHVIVEGDHDYLAILLMAATQTAREIARITLVSPQGERFEASAGSTTGPDHDTHLGLAVAASGLWQTSEATTPGGDVSLKAVGVKHELRATGGFSPMESDMCHLYGGVAADSVPVAFPGQATNGAFPNVLVTTAAIGGLAGAAWYHARTGRFAWLAPLFVKLNRHQVEHQHVRKAIVDLIQARPGLTTQEIRTELDLAWGETAHHVNVLQQGGILIPVQWGRNRHWFDQRHVTAADRALQTALHHTPARRMLEALWAAPGTRQEELSAQLRLHRATLQFHARKLAALGLLDRRREAAQVRYYALVRKPASAALTLATEQAA